MHELYDPTLTLKEFQQSLYTYLNNLPSLPERLKAITPIDIYWIDTMSNYILTTIEDDPSKIDASLVTDMGERLKHITNIQMELEKEAIQLIFNYTQN